MKICVDRDSCVGHARCATAAPEVFELDDIGYIKKGDIEVPAGLEDRALAGVNACPEGALSVAGNRQ
jgi:ferredoxin